MEAICWLKVCRFCLGADDNYQILLAFSHKYQFTVISSHFVLEYLRANLLKMVLKNGVKNGCSGLIPRLPFR